MPDMSEMLTSVDAASERSVVINQLIWPTVHPVQWAASLSLSLLGKERDCSIIQVVYTALAS